MLKKLFSFLNRLMHKVLFSVSSFIKTDERQELLEQVDTHLLVWNQELLNLDTGQSIALQGMAAEDLVLAVIEIVSKGEKNKLVPHVALYLPNTEFVATEYQLPGIALQNVPAALKYQVDDLLPAYPRELLLAVNHNESNTNNIALWLDKPRSEELFNAFKEQGVELTAILPRIALLTLDKNLSVIKHSSRQFKEIDEHGILAINLENQTLVQWSFITRNEMNDEDYFQQWENSLNEPDDTQVIDSVSFFEKIDRTHLAQIRYTFFPEATRTNLKQHSRLKKGRLAIIAGVIAALLIAFPFVKNSIRHAKWEKKYLEYKEKTTEVRKMRASVTQFEDNWALFLEYPKVNIVAIIQKLNFTIPKNSWISVFEITDDVVKIEGYSPNATKILEIISKQPEFEQAAFNQRTRAQRGKTDEHFGISFHLKAINMDAYREKHFPVR